MNTPKGIGSKSREELGKVLRNSDGILTSERVALILKVSRKQASDLLSRWANRGWIMRVRRGFYTPLSIESVEESSVIEDPWLIAHEIYSPCYIGGWTAAMHWDLTEQIFESICVISSKKQRAKQATIKEVLFNLKSVQEEKYFGLKTVWRGKTKVRISDPSKTIADMLSDPALGGGIRSVMDILMSYLDFPHFNQSLLLEYCSKMNNRTIFKRLGFLVEKLRPDLSEVLEFCLEHISSGNSQLDPSIKGTKLVTHWRLWIPKGMFDD